MKIKILYKNKQNALIQFSNEIQAHSAKFNLNGVKFFGNTLNINDSKVSEVMTYEANDSLLTKDFSQSNNFRYNGDQSSNTKNLSKPSSVLHFSNLHQSVDLA